jgi:alginate O-acetyltransferase complex protein AlgI
MWLLLAASCLFYMAFVPAYILILFYLIVVDYFAAFVIERAQGRRRKLLLGISLVANVGTLFFFKYYNFFSSEYQAILQSIGVQIKVPHLGWVLPIGLSFHTFQAMAYTIEVYRGRCKPEKNPLIYALYVMFYPQLVAGPIERPNGLLPQLHQDLRFDYELVTSGLRLMLWGYLKKVFVADRLAVLVDQIYSRPSDYHGLGILIASYAFTFQIYYDFSGYSDIATGAARVMGFDLMKNFDRPYYARSISDFWKRWHISLSSWFRDYLYIPLGGNSGAMTRRMLNVLIVFLVSGLWHGANWTFLIWGALHGAYYVTQFFIGPFWTGILSQLKLNQRVSARVNCILTFHFVAFAWIFFRAGSVTEAWTFINQGFTAWSDLAGHRADLTRLGLGPFELFLSVVGVCFIEYGEYLGSLWRSTKKFLNFPIYVRWATYYVGLILLALFGRFAHQQFIYFQF